MPFELKSLHFYIAQTVNDIKAIIEKLILTQGKGVFR